jgi:hypothetical protein
MEDALNLYLQPCYPQQLLVNYDEWRRALSGETYTSLPPQPGRRKRVDYEYRRISLAYLHMAFEHLRGQRNISVSPEHAHQDFALCMK